MPGTANGAGTRPLLANIGEVVDAQCCMSPARPRALLSTDVHLCSEQPREGTPGKNAEHRAARQGACQRSYTTAFVSQNCFKRFSANANNQLGILRCL